jgi:hypothetical protein
VWSAYSVLLLLISSTPTANHVKRSRGDTLVKFSAPAMSRSNTVKPFARRLSLPARRLSESFATVIATPFRTHLPDVEPPSYFNPIPLTCEPIPLSTVDSSDQDIQTVETEVAIEEFACVVEVEASPRHSVKKVTKVKRVTRKMKSLIGYRSAVPLSS